MRNNKLICLLPLIMLYYAYPLLVSKGQVHEGILHNSDKGSVITWDFDVMRHDVVFTVYRLKIPLSLHTLAPSSTLSSDRTAHNQALKTSANTSTANSKSSPQPSPKFLCNKLRM